MLDLSCAAGCDSAGGHVELALERTVEGGFGFVTRVQRLEARCRRSSRIVEAFGYVKGT